MKSACCSSQLAEMDERYRQRGDDQQDLTEEEAFVVLEPYFLAARKVFGAFCEGRGLGKDVLKTRFECSSHVRDSERHFAATTVDGRRVLAAPDMVNLPEDTVAAIFSHEFGHVVDHLYPGCFVLQEDELLFLAPIESSEDVREDKKRIARMRQWDRRVDHEVEVVADKIAEVATGSRIGYSGKCMLQGLNRGVPRPAKLT